AGAWNTSRCLGERTSSASQSPTNHGLSSMPTPTSAPGPVTPLPSGFSQAGSTSSIRTRRRRLEESDHSRVLALLAGQQRRERRSDVRMAEPESCRLKPCGQRPDASEQLAGYLAKRGP